MSDAPCTLIRSLGICDGSLSVAGSTERPAGLLLQQGNAGPLVLAAGRLEHVERHPAAMSARRVDMGRAVLTPGFINAHTHLDLTVIGPQPHDPDDGFVHWVNTLRQLRRTQPEAIAASVRDGVELSRAGGVSAVGDIAGAVAGQASILAAEALRSTGIAGVSFLEFFAIGSTERERLDHALGVVRSHFERFSGPLRLGIQPHATNTVSRAAFSLALEAANGLGLRSMTHLAESPEERMFVADAQGPQRGLLEGLGLWNEELEAEFGRGASPVEQLASVLSPTRTAAVHVNQCSDRDLELLAEADLPVVYCPRASDYFGAERHFGPHRYRDMIRSGLTVAVGTDSIVNLPVGTTRISPIDEIRFLYRRDKTDPMVLFRMAFDSGARVLGLPDGSASLAPGASPLAVVSNPIPNTQIDCPASALLRADSSPEFVPGQIVRE